MSHQQDLTNARLVSLMSSVGEIDRRVRNIQANQSPGCLTFAACALAFIAWVVGAAAWYERTPSEADARYRVVAAAVWPVFFAEECAEWALDRRREP